MQTQTFDTKTLLRPAQLEEARSEIKTLEAKIKNPGIEDKKEALKQLRRVSKSVAEQTPIPPQSGEEEGRMARAELTALSYQITVAPAAGASTVAQARLTARARLLPRATIPRAFWPPARPARVAMGATARMMLSVTTTAETVPAAATPARLGSPVQALSRPWGRIRSVCWP